MKNLQGILFQYLEIILKNIQLYENVLFLKPTSRTYNQKDLYIKIIKKKNLKYIFFCKKIK